MHRVTPETQFVGYRERIIGGVVRARRLAGNSLLVYIDAEPGDGNGLTLWLEPTWHLRDEARVLAGSRQAQHDADADDPDAGFNQTADGVNVLLGRRVTGLELEPATGDLVLTLDGGLTLRTFASDPDTDELWHIRDNATKQRVSRTGRAFKLPVADV
jgi:hypothetical protein